MKFQRGTLWHLTVERTAHALQRGAIHPIPTESHFIEDNGIEFRVHLVSAWAPKERAKESQKDDPCSSPFLAYESDLFVAELSKTHLCLLNKYNVVKHHLLIVTKAFEEQESALTLADFQALWTCMEEFEGLGFYNAGAVAGASQRHKHLQLIPLSLADRGPKIPIDPLLAEAHFEGLVGTIPRFSFVHALAKVEDISYTSKAAPALLERYRMLLEAVGLEKPHNGESLQPYNLLITRQWMLLIPRTSECCYSISVNSLGFAGVFLVKNTQQWEALRHYGPMRVLEQVALAKAKKA